jgi:hypothetical protein
MPILKFTLLFVFAFGSLLAIGGQDSAGDSITSGGSTKKSRFEIQVNGIYATMETNLRFESATGILGVKINFEDNLGMDKHRILPMFNVRFNIKNRHNIFAMYYGLPRDSYYVTKRDIEFRDRFIPAGTEVFSHFNTNVYSLGYMYDVFDDERSRLGLFANFYILTVASGISSNAEQLNENFTVTAPLPNFGAQAYYKINDWFGVSGLFSLIFLSVGDYARSIHTLGGQMDFYLLRWLEAGLGYYLFDINLEVSKTQFTGLFDYIYQGPYLSLGFRF